MSIFVLFQIGGYVVPTLENSFLLMLMRMVLVVPLMASLAGKLYPRNWQGLRELSHPKSRHLLRRSLGGGVKHISSPGSALSLHRVNRNRNCHDLIFYLSGIHSTLFLATIWHSSHPVSLDGNHPGFVRHFSHHTPYPKHGQ